MDGRCTGGTPVDALGSELRLELLTHVGAPPQDPYCLQRVRCCWWTAEMTARYLMGCRVQGDSRQAAHWSRLLCEPLEALLCTVRCLLRAYSTVCAAGVTHGSTQVITTSTRDTELLNEKVTPAARGSDEFDCKPDDRMFNETSLYTGTAQANKKLPVGSQCNILKITFIDCNACNGPAKLTAAVLADPVPVCVSLVMGPPRSDIIETTQRQAACGAS